MVSKKILGSGIGVGILISTIVGIAIYNEYLDPFSSTSNDRTVTDFLGRKVDLPDADKIERVVGIQPGSLRLLTYMDAEDLVCGVEEIERTMDYGRPYIYAYPELSDLPSIGPAFGGEAELILAQEPDVIFATLESIQSADELQDLTGIPVIVLNYGEDFGDLQMDDLYKSLEIIGEVLDKENRADYIIDYMKDLIENLDDRTKDIDDDDKEWIYLGGIGKRGVHGITSTDCQYEPLEFINGKNSASDVGEGYYSIDIEQLFQWEEDDELDYILVDGGGYGACMVDLQDESGTYGSSGAGAGLLHCIHDSDPVRAIMVLPYNFYNPNIENIFINAYYLGNRFFPEKFDDLNYTDGKLYDTIYNEFLGEEVYDDMADYYVPNYEGFHNISKSEIADYRS
ncbi:MAG: ABC transporter substrate-binding protein [Candidatus Lokiarchaeota archaeon]|nr:ABC transporter substrate-binding protein [Candidatus Lokiarchaeota archaeon]